MKHKKRYRWFKSHQGLRKSLCSAHGHTWSYNHTVLKSGRLKGKIRRICASCRETEYGNWYYNKRKGWVFK